MQDLKAKAASGVNWSALNTICITGLQFIQLAILGRILRPDDFGLMALVMIVNGFGQVFADMGLSSAIIQRKNINKEELSTLYWINILSGIIIFGIIFLIAPMIAKIFQATPIETILPVAALSFVISSFAIQFRTLLRKNLQFDVTTKINICSNILGMLLSVCLAWIGYGVWSLVWGGLCNTSVNAGLLVICGWKQNWWPMLYFRWSDSRGYISFGLYRIGAMVTNYFHSRIDQLLIGFTLGPVALGYYNIAYRLVIQPIQKLSPILTSVAFPVFSIIQDETERLKKGYFQMIQFLVFLNAPILIGLAAIAPEFVPLLIGEKWVPAIPLVQILAFYALVRSLGNAAGSLIVAKGKANWTLYWNICLTMIVPPTVYFTSISGQLIHIAIALLLLQCAFFLGQYGLFIRRLLGPCFKEYLQVMKYPLFSAIIMGSLILFFAHLMEPLSINVRFIVNFIIGIFSYLIMSWLCMKSIIGKMINLLPFGIRLKRLIGQNN